MVGGELNGQITGSVDMLVCPSGVFRRNDYMQGHLERITQSRFRLRKREVVQENPDTCQLGDFSLPPLVPFDPLSNLSEATLATCARRLEISSDVPRCLVERQTCFRTKLWSKSGLHTTNHSNMHHIKSVLCLQRETRVRVFMFVCESAPRFHL